MTLPLAESHPDFPVLSPLVRGLTKQVGGLSNFQIGVAQLLRIAIDEVIDAPRTNRFTLDQTEKTEKTYLGTKVEILFRDFLGLPKGTLLDLSVGGIECDIKNTIGGNWSIPSENVGHPAILIKSNEKTAKCDLGVAVIHEAYLNPGKNRDSKRGLSRNGVQNVWWLMVKHGYPPNFFELLDRAEREEIMNSGKATARIASLFRKVQDQPISRMQIQALAQQKDYMKRIRRNGGARDVLAPEGIAILWGSKDRDLIHSLGLGCLSDEEFISFTPKTSAQRALLRGQGHID